MIHKQHILSIDIILCHAVGTGAGETATPPRLRQTLERGTSSASWTWTSIEIEVSRTPGGLYGGHLNDFFCFFFD